MKRVLWILVLVLLCTCAAAQERTDIGFENTLIDLDNDGAPEEVHLKMDGPELEQVLRLVIIGADGGINVQITDLMYGVEAFAADIDGDGIQEIFLTGDIDSSDYETWCVHYTDEGIQIVPFQDAGRTENTQDYCESGYGRLTGIGEGTVVLTGSQDIVGTWFAERTFTLTEDGFALLDGGIYVFPREEDMDEEYFWAYGPLTLQRDLEAWDDNDQNWTVAKGTFLYLTASDKNSKVWFETADGQTGYFTIEPDTARGWGRIINGVSEAQVFEYVPYAD